MDNNEETNVEEKCISEESKHEENKNSAHKQNEIKEPPMIVTYILLALAFIMFIVLIRSCFGGSSSHHSSDSYSGYSSTYKNDSSYRNNVKSIADAWGVSEREVDGKITAVTGGK